MRYLFQISTLQNTTWLTHTRSWCWHFSTRDKDRCAATFSELVVARKKLFTLQKQTTAKKTLLTSLPEYKQNYIMKLEPYHLDQVLWQHLKLLRIPAKTLYFLFVSVLGMAGNFKCIILMLKKLVTAVLLLFRMGKLEHFIVGTNHGMDSASKQHPNQ